MVDYRDFFLQLSDEEGVFVKETSRSIIMKCPVCNKDKLYLDKTKGNFICFSGSCEEKGQAVKLIVLYKNISYKEAKDLLYGKIEFQNKPKIEFDSSVFDTTSSKVESKNKPTPIEKPAHFYAINNNESADGRSYLGSRGIDVTLAQKYGIEYSPLYRRVIFPIKDGSEWIGYQARAIDPVDKGARMRNNPGFQKGLTFMFLDKVTGYDHVIVAEGPVDALKFDLCGGNIASLGKEITDAQLKILNELPISKVYWALDDDALNLIKAYSSKLDKKSFLIQVPDSAQKRAESQGKKADFGECTLEECLQAFKDAENVVGKILIGRLNAKI